jgi:hypothetical protein
MFQQRFERKVEMQVATFRNQSNQPPDQRFLEAPVVSSSKMPERRARRHVRKASMDTKTTQPLYEFMLR